MKWGVTYKCLGCCRVSCFYAFLRMREWQAYSDVVCRSNLHVRWQWSDLKFPSANGLEKISNLLLRDSFESHQTQFRAKKSISNLFFKGGYSRLWNQICDWGNSMRHRQPKEPREGSWALRETRRRGWFRCCSNRDTLRRSQGPRCQLVGHRQMVFWLQKPFGLPNIWLLPPRLWMTMFQWPRNQPLVKWYSLRTRVNSEGRRQIARFPRRVKGEPRNYQGFA